MTPEWLAAMAVGGADKETVFAVLKSYAIPLLVEITVVVFFGGYILTQRLEERITGHVTLVDAKINAEHSQMKLEIDRVRSEQTLLLQDVQRQLNERAAIDAESLADRMAIRKGISDLKIDLLTHDRRFPKPSGSGKD